MFTVVRLQKMHFLLPIPCTVGDVVSEVGYFEKHFQCETFSTYAQMMSSSTPEWRASKLIDTETYLIEYNSVVIPVTKQARDLKAAMSPFSITLFLACL